MFPHVAPEHEVLRVTKLRNERVHVPWQCWSRTLLVLPRSFATEGQVHVETVPEQKVPLVQSDVDHD